MQALSLACAASHSPWSVRSPAWQSTTTFFGLTHFRLMSTYAFFTRSRQLASRDLSALQSLPYKGTRG